jgi:tetratricopeptide (TPR) repeat protein
LFIYKLKYKFIFLLPLMKIFYLGFSFLFILFIPVYAFGYQNVTASDTNEVIRLNKEAYKVRLSDATQTVRLADKALKLAQKLKYINGIAEAYRTKGIGLGYQYDQVHAFDCYMDALSSFQSVGNKNGTAKVYNNIGNLYRDNDYETALNYFKQGLSIAVRLKDTALLASLNLNIGNVYYRKKQYFDAIAQFAIARKMFEQVHDDANLISCLQNTGVAYFSMGQYDKAKEMLLQANEGAKKLDMNATISSIDLALADVYIAKREFDDAEKIIKEGSSYSLNKKVDYDYKHTTYELEYKRKNYEKALYYLTNIYQLDSLDHQSYVSNQIIILKDRYERDASKKEKVLLEEQRKNSNYMFWGALLVAALSIGVIGLLVVNVKRKAETNNRLTELNAEVSRQKDNLDRINHHLEEIIDERTKDLQIKNKKLSEYSSYLSHQIRGPIATLKGLMNLEKEGLVDKQECINMMNKCVSEIDDKIINMSDMLHDPDRAGF